jgi:gamma-glutamyltranspeptidase/glutathione hydrolase
VPGAVAGLTEAHRRFGRLAFSTVIAPAIGLAYDGFLVDEYRSSSIGEDSARLVLFPASRATFLPNDRPPETGSTFRQPELGATL